MAGKEPLQGSRFRDMETHGLLLSISLGDDFNKHWGLSEKFAQWVPFSHSHSTQGLTG